VLNLHDNKRKTYIKCLLPCNKNVETQETQVTQFTSQNTSRLREECVIVLGPRRRVCLKSTVRQEDRHWRCCCLFRTHCATAATTRTTAATTVAWIRLLRPSTSSCLCSSLSSSLSTSSSQCSWNTSRLVQSATGQKKKVRLRSTTKRISWTLDQIRPNSDKNWPIKIRV